MLCTYWYTNMCTKLASQRDAPLTLANRTQAYAAGAPGHRTGASLIGHRRVPRPVHLACGTARDRRAVAAGDWACTPTSSDRPGKHRRRAARGHAHRAALPAARAARHRAAQARPGAHGPGRCIAGGRGLGHAAGPGRLVSCADRCAARAGQPGVGRRVHGFVCEPIAVEGATDISTLGAWCACLQQLCPSPVLSP
jgi:hypothetical protein